MKPYSNRTIAQRIQAVHTATHNAANNVTVKTAMARRGYTVAKINAGGALADAADTAVANTTAARGEQVLNTNAVEEAVIYVGKAYQRLAKTARAIFADTPAALNIMGLTGKMPTGRASLITAAKALFNSTNYTDNMRTALEENEYDSPKLSLERGRIAEAESAIAMQAQAKAKYQTASQAQRTALKAMDKWMSRFLKTARLVFEDDPQQVEQLLVPARSTLTRAQREGRRKAAATRAAKRAQPELGLSSAA